MLQPHIKCDNGQVAKYVLLPGDPARARKIAEYLDEAKEVVFNREFLTITGKYKGVDVSITSTGIGCPSAAIAVEELANIGAEVFIRVGTCGALREGINNGDIIIPFASTRSEGTTKEYVSVEFPAVADFEVFQALTGSAKESGATFFTGINRTHDGFYENISNILRWATFFKDRRFNPKKVPLISSEMECSAVFLVAMLRGLKAGALMSVNTVEPLSALAVDPDLIYKLDESKESIKGTDNEIKIALEAVLKLAK